MKKKFLKQFDILNFDNIADVVMFLFIGAFIFDKLLPSFVYIMMGLFFILYFVAKVIFCGRISINKGIIWQIGFLFLSAFSLLYAKELHYGILYTVFTTFVIIFSFSQYFTNKSLATASVEKVLRYFVFWGSCFTLFVLFSQWTAFGNGGRLGTRALGEQFGGATAFSYYSILITVILIWYTFYSRKNKVFFISLTTASLFLNMMTGGRKAVLLPLIFFVVYGYLLNHKKAKKLLLYVVLSGLILFFAIFLSIKIPLIYNVFGYRVEAMLSIFLDTTNVDQTTLNSDQYRFSLIKEGFLLFAQKPFIGYGIGSSRLLFNQIGLGYIHAHNNFIEMLLSGGLIMFIGWYWIYVYLIVKIWLLKKKTNLHMSYFFISFLIMSLISDYGSTMYNVLHFNLFITLSAIYLASITKENSIKSGNYI